MDSAAPPREPMGMLTEARNGKEAQRIKAIVCAVDRRTAATVVRAAGHLSFRLGARLVLASVVDEPSLRHSRATRERARARAARQMQEHLSRLAEEMPKGLQPERRVELGHPVERLLEIADDEDAELLVVGSRGRGAFSSALLGSVSRAIARRAPCPVMIVTPRALKYSVAQIAAGGGEARSVVCGVDGSERSLAAARLAADLARRLGDRLVLVHAYDPTEGPPAPWTDGDGGKANPVEQALASIDGPAEGVLRPGPAAYALESVANRQAARLIVVGGRDRGDLRAALAGSVSAQLLRVAGCPIVVLPEHAKLALGSGHYEAAGVWVSADGREHRGPHSSIRELDDEVREITLRPVLTIEVPRSDTPEGDMAFAIDVVTTTLEDIGPQINISWHEESAAETREQDSPNDWPKP
jgi:nucleotide-binding universal stress UspA family protein